MSDGYQQCEGDDIEVSGVLAKDLKEGVADNKRDDKGCSKRSLAGAEVQEMRLV